MDAASRYLERLPVVPRARPVYVVAGFSRPFSGRLKADATYNRKTL